MADNPITRKEKYLAKLTGSYTGNVPDPITRVEKYLYDLCQKGISGLTPEEIENAVNKYLKENPVQPGATTEQAQQIKQNTDDVASLKEDISTKITKFYASSQGETHLADSDNGKIMDMMLYGKSEQKQYSGKNLLNATLQTTTQNGVTCTANGDGTYTLNGTATNNCYFKVGMLLFKSAKKYKVIGCPTGGSEKTYYLGYDKSPWYSDIGTGQSFTFNGDADEQISSTIGIKSSTVCNNLLFKPMVTTDLTATYDDFEPYTGGQPSPSPDYPQEIKSVVNPTVKVVGKNLLNTTLQTTTQSGVTFTANGDGTYTLNGIAKALIDVSLSKNFHIENGKMYRITGWVKNVSGSIYLVNGKDSAGDTGDGVTFTYIDATNDSKVIHIQIPKGAIINNVIIKPMICTDASATYDDFEPYHEQTVTLPYTLNAIPVNSGGNVTIDGQQYIADYVDVERGKRIKMVGEVDLGSLDWTYMTRYTAFAANVSGKADGQNMLCSMYINYGIANLSSMPDMYICANSRGEQFFIKNSKYTDADAFKQAMSGAMLYYELATPEEIDLTTEEIKAFELLQTYYPTTNISVNSEQLDGYTIFNYPISMENGWNYVKQQIGDTRDYIYDMDARTQDTDLQAAEAYVNSEYAVALTELEV